MDRKKMSLMIESKHHLKELFLCAINAITVFIRLISYNETIHYFYKSLNCI